MIDHMIDAVLNRDIEENFWRHVLNERAIEKDKEQVSEKVLNEP